MTDTNISARVINFLDYLSDFDARRNPPVTDIKVYGRFLLAEDDVPSSQHVEERPSDDVWLSVDFVDVPPAPAVPPALADVIQLDRVTPDSRPKLPDDLDDERRERAEHWIDTEWELWRERTATARQIKALHRDLFALRDELDLNRDSVELVWGFGPLRWKPNDSITVDHPLITVPMEIAVDADTQRIDLRTNHDLHVETTFLAGLDVANRSGITARVASINTEPVDPWDPDELTSTLRKLVRDIDHDGIVGPPPSRSGPDAVASGGWVLYVRLRRPDYQGFLDRLREMYDNGVEVPLPLASVVADEPSELVARTSGNGDGSASSERLLLPLPSNEDQERILRLAQIKPGVTVQGPPGTGKSHTIANLVSHYVAQGKRVLVTAEKEAALRVLGEKIPDDIRHLTVSVLGGDRQSQQELRTAIEQIQARSTAFDPDNARREIIDLERQIDEADGDIARTLNDLRSAAHTESVNANGEWECGSAPTLMVASAWLAANETALDVIPDELPLGQECPLEQPEFDDLVRLAAAHERADLDAALLELPPIDQLPTVDEARVLYSDLGAAEAEESELDGRITSWDAVDAESATLAQTATTARSWAGWLDTTVETWVGRLRQSLDDGHLLTEWSAGIQALQAERASAFELRSSLAAHTVEITGNPDPQFRADLVDAQRRLTGGGKLGMFARRAAQAIECCTIDGRTASTADDVAACIGHIDLSIYRHRLATRWNNLVAPYGGPPADPTAPEQALAAKLDAVHEITRWRSEWPMLRTRIAVLVRNAPERGAPHGLRDAADIIDRCAASLERRRLRGVEADISNRLEAGRLTPTASPLWTALHGAHADRDALAWDAARSEVVRLWELRPDATTARTLHRMLGTFAPLLALRVIDSGGTDRACSVTITRAWEWRQLETWVRYATSRYDPVRLQLSLEQLGRDRRRLIEELVSTRAWLALSGNLEDRHRQALSAYMNAVRKLGKGTGKYAPRWIREMRIAIDKAKDAVPVWIMTTSRVLSTFTPSDDPPFDVLIVDEASQIGIHESPLLSLARCSIVVGDDQQTSPELVGLNQGAIHELLDEHLSEIDDYRVLFDPANSLYDLAAQRFADQVMLTEHFRSLPDIIQFSNTHIYSDRIVPLRDRPPAPNWAAVGTVFVENGHRTGDVNQPEVDAVVDLIREILDDSRYDGMDIGVVGLLGSSQSKAIYDRCFDEFGGTVLTERRMRFGEAANFQGDERDIMIISMVAAPKAGDTRGRIGAMTSEAHRRRFNVAASRARNLMWIVHSVPADTFHQDDLRGSLIRHCAEPARLTTDATSLHERCDSDFEREIVTELLANGYTAIDVQYKVGRYRIDIVVEGPESRLAIEADGDRWHGDDRWHQDRARQTVLERAGWTFVRIRGSSFYRDRENALEPLWARLEELNIPADDAWRTTPQQAMKRIVGGEATDESAENDEPFFGNEDSDEIDREPERAEAKPERDAWPALGDSTAGSGRSFAPPPDGAVLFPQPTAAIDSSIAESILPRPVLPQPTAKPGHVELGEYDERRGDPFVPVTDAEPHELIDGLAEIVAAEGPMHIGWAVRRYVVESGFKRVGHLIRADLVNAMADAVRGGRIAAVGDNVSDPLDKTVYEPGTSPVKVRELGPRSLTDVPRSELRALAESLGVADQHGEQMQRPILDRLGLVRLTTKTVEYLDESLSYERQSGAN